jgi:hypothetical protein
MAVVAYLKQDPERHGEECSMPSSITDASQETVRIMTEKLAKRTIWHIGLTRSPEKWPCSRLLMRKSKPLLCQISTRNGHARSVAIIPITGSSLASFAFNSAAGFNRQ